MKINLRDWIDYSINVYKLLRPKFYNRITWVIVICGITILSTPIISRILEKLIEAKLNIKVTDNNDSLYGFLLICVGLLYHLANTGLHEFINWWKEKTLDKNKIEHDIELFKMFDNIINEEQLNFFIDKTCSNHSYLTKQCDKIEIFINKGKLSANTFMISEIENAKKSLVKVMDEYTLFLSNSFFQHGPLRDDHQLYMCLYPNLNIDRGGYPTEEQEKFYDKKRSELFDLSHNVLNNYNIYRTCIKNHLFT